MKRFDLGASSWLAFGSFLLFFAASIPGCDSPDHSTISSCTNFSGHDLGTVPGSPEGCDGGFFVVVSDAPLDGLAEFWITLERVELLADDGEFLFWEGPRRVDLLQLRERGLLLATRDDVPEVYYDAVRVTLSEPTAVARDDALPWTLHSADLFLMEVILEDPVLVVDDFLQGLRLDLDLGASLREESLGQRTFAPVLLTETLDEDHTLEVHQFTGVVLQSAHDGELLVVGNHGEGEVRVLHQGLQLQRSLSRLRVGDPVQIYGAYVQGAMLLDGFGSLDPSFDASTDEPRNAYQGELEHAADGLWLHTEDGPLALVLNDDAHVVNISDDLIEPVPLEDLETGTWVEVHGPEPLPGVVTLEVVIARP